MPLNCFKFVGYKHCLCYLHGIPRFCSTCPGQVAASIDTSDALIRKCLYHFIARCKRFCYRYVGLL